MDLKTGKTRQMNRKEMLSKFGDTYFDPINEIYMQN